MAITTPGGAVLRAQTTLDGASGTVAVTIPDPALWWPNGHGAQPLYRVEIRLHGRG